MDFAMASSLVKKFNLPQERVKEKVTSFLNLLEEKKKFQQAELLKQEFNIKKGIIAKLFGR